MIAAIDQLTSSVAQGTDPRHLPAPFVAAIVVGAVVVLIIFGIIISFFRIWIRAFESGVHVSFGVLIGMRLRKTPVERIVNALIAAHQAGVGDVTVEKLERHHLAGGDVTQVARALAAARAADIELTFEHAAAIDLNGRDVVAEVRQAAGGVPPPGA